MSGHGCTILYRTCERDDALQNNSKDNRGGGVNLLMGSSNDILLVSATYGESHRPPPAVGCPAPLAHCRPAHSCICQGSACQRKRACVYACMHACGACVRACMHIRVYMYMRACVSGVWRVCSGARDRERDPPPRVCACMWDRA